MLPDIPNVTVIRKGITRILGQNPGPFTLQGTNTYLIASEKNSVLIDTGEGKPGYLGFLESTLRSNPPVSDIILSHWHRDHVGGLPSVLKLINQIQCSNNRTSGLDSSNTSSIQQSKFPKVWKFKSSSSTPTLNELDHQTAQDQLLEHDQEIHQEIVQTYQDLMSIEDNENFSKRSNDGQDPTTLNWLSDRQVFHLSTDRRIEVLHTPGHTDDSICCLLHEGEEGSAEGGQLGQQPSAVLVGDTILGGSSTIFEDLVVYLQSLKKLLGALNPGLHQSTGLPTHPQPVPLYPGHGQLIQDGAQSIQQFIAHRMDRERQIVQIFHKNNQDQFPDNPNHYLTAENLVEIIYPPDLPKEVYPAALHGINQHLKKLKHDGVIDQLESDPRYWYLVSPQNADH